MSAIAGRYNLDGQPTSPLDLLPMIEAMAHRCPDGHHTWHHHGVGLAHGMLLTTPESLDERLPLSHPEADLILTADARIDNRTELINHLDLPEDLPDSALILAAYARWGEACVEHLVGDFAFALWDGSSRKLFCARDHFGLRPFYYHHRAGRCFIFATEIKGLLTQPEVPEQLNEVRVADYLAGIREDAAITIYEDIWRLPAGHVLVVDAGGVRRRRYYEVRPASGVGSGWSDAEYAERFRELFEEAVRCRVRSAFPVGSELSGGLDSSYVACVARDVLAEEGSGPLETISLVYEEVVECDERPYIEAVLGHRDGFNPHFVSGDDITPLSILDQIYAVLDDGLVGGTYHHVWMLRQTAQQAGVRVVLDGFDGDATVDHGDRIFSELAHQGAWGAFAREAVFASQRYYHADHRHPFQEVLASDGAIMNGYGWPVIGSYAAQGNWLRFFKEASRVRKHYMFRWRDLLRRYGRQLLLPSFLQQQKEKRFTYPALVRAEVAQRVGLKDRIERYAYLELDDHTVRGKQRLLLGGDRFPYSLELQNHVTSSFGMEMRHPFMDKRLIEYCLALPPEQSLNEGWTRVVMRRAMEGIVPDEITWRVGKGRMSASFARGVFGPDATLLQKHVEDLGPLEAYVNQEVLHDMYRRRHTLSNSEQVQLVQVAAFASWLKKRFAGTIEQPTIRHLRVAV